MTKIAIALIIAATAGGCCHERTVYMTREVIPPGWHTNSAYGIADGEVYFTTNYSYGKWVVIPPPSHCR